MFIADTCFEVIAISRKSDVSLDTNTASAGIRMLFSKGHDLERLLMQNELLQDMEDASTPSGVRRCTSMHHVRQYFVDVCYVIVSKAALLPFRACPDGQCTCFVFCRYGDCEHAEFVRMLPLRVRSATSSGHMVPTQKKRGRKRGPTTQRAKATASKKQREQDSSGPANAE